MRKTERSAPPGWDYDAGDYLGAGSRWTRTAGDVEYTISGHFHANGVPWFSLYAWDQARLKKQMEQDHPSLAKAIQAAEEHMKRLE